MNSFCMVCDKFVPATLFDACEECINELKTFEENDDYSVSESSIEPCQPTRAYPGTEEKIQILVSRESNREELWHKDDIVIDRPMVVSIDTMAMLRAERFTNFIEKLRTELGV